MKKAVILGSGSFGTALAMLLDERGLDTVVWGRNAEAVDEINSRHTNDRYLSGIDLPASIQATTSLSCCADADVPACVSTDNDVNNCGGCGVQCSDGEFCVGGSCVCEGMGGTVQICDTETQVCCPGQAGCDKRYAGSGDNERTNVEVKTKVDRCHRYPGPVVSKRDITENICKHRDDQDDQANPA